MLGKEEKRKADMGVLDFFKKDKQLVLDYDNFEEWPRRLIEDTGFDKELKKFISRYQKKRAEVEDAVDELHDEEKINSLQENVKHIVRENIKIISEKADQVLNFEFLNEFFLIESQQKEFIELVNQFKQKTRKNFSTAEDYFEEESERLKKKMSELEDLVINFSRVLEEKNYHKIIKIKEVCDEHKTNLKNRRKLKRRKRAVKKSIDKIQKKIESIKEKIEEYIEKSSSKEYEKIQIEEEDLQKKLKKINKEYKEFVTELLEDLREKVKMTQGMKDLLLKLKLDASTTIENLTSSKIKKIKKLSEEAEEGFKERLKELYEKLHRDKKTVEDVKKKVESLKKKTLSDITALNILEQKKFLRREKKRLLEKEKKLEKLKEEMKKYDAEKTKEELLNNIQEFTSVIKNAGVYDEEEKE